jgi:hypothetical protein
VELLLQTAASLVAILALAGLAWWMRLGGSPRLGNDDAVRSAAGEVEDGFTPIAIARDPAGTAALARDPAGRIMVIKRHGNRFAGRVLSPGANARLAGDTIKVDCAEARFGTVALTLSDAETWAEAINRVNRSGDA